MHIKSFVHCYVSLKTYIYVSWRDSNPGLLVPEADAMSTAPSRQGKKTEVNHYYYFLLPTISESTAPWLGTISRILF
jgi:hypothetical protein